MTGSGRAVKIHGTASEELYATKGVYLTIQIEFQAHRKLIIQTKIVECASIHDHYVKSMIFKALTKLFKHSYNWE